MPDDTRHFFSVDGLSAELVVLGFEGSEALSELFHFAITVGCEQALGFSDVVGKKALLTMRVDSGDRHVHGLAMRLEHLATNGKSNIYRATLTAAEWRLQQRRDNRIFQALTAPQIIQKVLEGAGLSEGGDFALKLQASYVVREYCVQYHETDWDFICRLMEDEGIFFFFEHEADKHVMLLSDHKSVHAELGDKLAFRPPQGALGAVEARGSYFSRFAYSEEVRSGAATMRDFDFIKPALLLEATKAADVNADLALYEYPGAYVLPATGSALAAIRLQEQQVLRKVGEGDSTECRLAAGCLVDLDEHPREDFNRKFLVTRVEHRGVEPTAAEVGDSSETTSYANRFEVIPSDVAFRPPRVSPRPTIRGVQTAIVVGPSSEEIHTDEHGRVKVQFHWDRLGKKDDKSSCWIRVSQVWSGAGWGGMQIPRIGQEVVVTFLDGDPDRPLIVGRVYHGANVPPYQLPANKTRSTIKSMSTPNGEAGNELRFEDKKGSEEVYLHGQKDFTIAIEHDKNQAIGHDETLDVKHDRVKQIEHDQIATIGNDDTLEVKNDRKETIDHDETVEVKHDRTTKVDHDHKEEIGNDETRKVGKDQHYEVVGKRTMKVGKQLTLDVGDDVKETFGAKHTLEIKGDRKVTISGAVSETFDKTLTTKVDGDASLDVGGGSKETVGKAKKLTIADELVIEVGQAKLTLKKDGTIKLEGVSFEIAAKGAVKINGVSIEAKSDTSVKLEAGANMALKASGPVKIDGAMVTAGGSTLGLG